MARIFPLAGQYARNKILAGDTGQRSSGGLPPEGGGCLREHPREGFRPTEDPRFRGVLYGVAVLVVQPVGDPNLVEVRPDEGHLEGVPPDEGADPPEQGTIGAGFEPVGGEGGDDAVLHIIILSVGGVPLPCDPILSHAVRFVKGLKQFFLRGSLLPFGAF